MSTDKERLAILESERRFLVTKEELATRESRIIKWVVVFGITILALVLAIAGVTITVCFQLSNSGG